ncbi:restriction endonuclease [Ornithinimicrobium avium]|uniref:Restriction endonuclease n=1 Tax=Ornithinimicrobium avium TaxID=2283195 RepID=A0A345NLR5_9MICO|nr:restriction endonuclease [Ornithinimicrobium avium]AXH95973.1 restriction endonuclease [Ornithinimicrobium avium]
MTIPDFQSLMRPVLAHLGDGQVVRSRAVKDSMVTEFALTPEEREQMIPSGRQRVMDNRVSWALTYLAQAGLIERPVRGQVEITPQGRAALTHHPERIDMKVLEDYPGYRAFKERTKVVADTPSGVETAQDAMATPQELVQAAVSQNRAALEVEVLNRALALSPTGFEDLVMVLLEKMGYGRLGTIARTSASGDAGVDGIISQDPLGLDRIYVQAKRYALDRTVDRPRIHEFAGALLGKQGDRGVYITTSSFTTGARSEAERINARIELIDGALLAELLVRYEVGVQVEQRVALHRMDEDFFDSIG